MNRKFERIEYIWIEIFCNIILVFTVTFDHLNASLLNNFFFFFFTDLRLFHNKPLNLAVFFHLEVMCSKDPLTKCM